MSLFIGKEVNITPTNDSKTSSVLGVITYIHPRGKFYTVEYKSRNSILRESFTPTNAEMLDLIERGVVKADAFPFIPPPEHVTAKELEAMLAENGVKQIDRKKKQ